jgi:hypothetical protein
MDFIRKFVATDIFTSQHQLIQVLVYFESGLSLYIVDIQRMGKNGWLDERDPFRSPDLADCIEHFEELLQNPIYVDVKEITT